jgi:uncharacterized protein (DUF1697 family)
VTANRHVALLRGINVGGSNIIKMADLRDSFDGMGFTDVATFIASGNVLFSAAHGNKSKLTAAIEKALSADFSYDSRVVVLSADELCRVIEQAPRGFGADASKYRYDVLFVRAPMNTRAALKEVPVKLGVDEAHAGDHALYFRRLLSKAAQSRLSRLTQLPVYQQLTVRKWSTTTKLLGLI